MTSHARQLQPPERYSIEEYLYWERLADVKSEYYDGRIVMMSGGSPFHSRIASNLIRRFGNALDGSLCGAYTSDLKIRSGPSQFVYPDVSVICGELQFHDAERDVVTNPHLIVQVLSPTTENNDRGVKWMRYQRLTSLIHYVLAFQDQPRIEHYFRDEAGEWHEETCLGLDAELSLPSLNCRIPLRQIYDGVELAPDAVDAEA